MNRSHGTANAAVTADAIGPPIIFVQWYATRARRCAWSWASGRSAHTRIGPQSTVFRSTWNTRALALR